MCYKVWTSKKAASLLLQVLDPNLFPHIYPVSHSTVQTRSRHVVPCLLIEKEIAEVELSGSLRRHVIGERKLICIQIRSIH